MLLGMKASLIALLLWLPGVAWAADAIYRVVGADGVVRYTDKPPHPNARPLQLYAPESAAAQTAPARARAEVVPEALRKAARFAVSVESPTPGQIMATDQVILAASVMPGLVSGFTLTYLIDGQAATRAPVQTLSLRLTPSMISVGEHRLQVAVRDDRGQELARSAEVRFSVVAP